MRRVFLSNFAPGDTVEDVFVLTNKQFAAASNGKPYIKAFCSDRSAQITARLWSATREIFNAIPDGGFVRICGHVENYQNNLQLIIEKIWPAKEGTFDLADLIPHTTGDIDKMCQRVFELCQSVQNRHLAVLLQTYLDDEELMNSFCKSPAAMNFHHAFIGGLLEHTLNAMEVADAICKFYPLLSRDLVIAGIFLHDIAKTWELKYDTSFSYTDAGQLVGHIVKSAMWVEERARRAEEIIGEPISRPLIDVLQHIILSHHGEPEFGAARVPSTPEAIAVHIIENLDAKLMMALTATRDEKAPAEGNWTEYLKQFNTRLYRPDVAPADAETIESPQPAPGAPLPMPSIHQAPPQKLAAGAESKSPVLESAMPPNPAKLAITNPLFERDASRKK